MVRISQDKYNCVMVIERNRTNIVWIKTSACGRTRRCSGRAQRLEIARILARDFVLTVSAAQTARR
jgi:hypothetical protein